MRETFICLELILWIEEIREMVIMVILDYFEVIGNVHLLSLVSFWQCLNIIGTQLKYILFNNNKLMKNKLSHMRICVIFVVYKIIVIKIVLIIDGSYILRRKFQGDSKVFKKLSKKIERILKIFGGWCHSQGRRPWGFSAAVPSWGWWFRILEK